MMQIDVSNESAESKINRRNVREDGRGCPSGVKGAELVRRDDSWLLTINL